MCSGETHESEITLPSKFRNTAAILKILKKGVCLDVKSSFDGQVTALLDSTTVPSLILTSHLLVKHDAAREKVAYAVNRWHCSSSYSCKQFLTFRYPEQSGIDNETVQGIKQKKTLLLRGCLSV